MLVIFTERVGLGKSGAMQGDGDAMGKNLKLLSYKKSCS